MTHINFIIIRVEILSKLNSKNENIVIIFHGAVTGKSKKTTRIIFRGSI